MTTNRLPPEGAWDHEVSCDLEDTSVASTNDAPTISVSSVAMAILHYSKENIQMKGWRTIAFNMALAVVGVLQTANWVDILPGQYTGPLVAVLGMVGIWLRSMTTTPAGQPAPAPVKK